MAIAGITSILDLYILEKADITNKMSDIMNEITYATKDSASLAQETSEKKAAAKEQYGESDAYYDAIDDINQDYELELAQITSWENDLEIKKEEYKSQLEVISNYEESYKNVQKKNIQNDFKYGQGG